MNNQTGSTKPLIVTMALPYANGDIHLGHMVEAVQTDIFVRAQKMGGRKTRFVCADDTHGTPIELNAHRQGITPEELIGRAWDNHTRDYASFGIGFDIFYTTNSEENKHWASDIFEKMKAKNLVNKKTIEQFYCEHDKRFLPDRFIKGICPKCGAEDQYGDVCEKCNSTYEPMDLKEPACVLCGNEPHPKTSEHFFVDLAQREDFLRNYLTTDGVLKDDMQNFVMNWVDGGLKEWCISRDGPYFGFKIPGTEDKYFYVWLDAPVGYISSTEKLCKELGENVNDYWSEDADAEVIHFIGKDIVYFHTLFWPVMLDAAELKLPSKIFVHGFLTVEGEKMSKSRGTFILAQDYAEKVKHPDATQFLRLYYAAKLSGGTADLDFNVEEFVNKINSTLINNIGNFRNRTSTFLTKPAFNNIVPDVNWDEAIAQEAADATDFVRNAIEQGNYRAAVDRIHALGGIANKYFNDTEIWKVVKSDTALANEIMVTCVNLIRTLGTLIKPILPEIVTRIEAQFDETFTWDSGVFAIRGKELNRADKLALPLETEMFDELYVAAPVEEVKPEPEEEQIEFGDFLNVKMRVGTILSAEKMKKSKKLLKIQLNDGYKTRQIMSGIFPSYEPEQLVGKKVVFVSNLKPAKLMGELSEGMILAAENESGELALVTVDKDFEAGAPVA